MLAEATNSGGNGAAGMDRPGGGAKLLPAPVDREALAALLLDERPEATWAGSVVAALDEEDDEEEIAPAAADEEEEEEEVMVEDSADGSTGNSEGHSSRVNQIAGTHGCERGMLGVCLRSSMASIHFDGPGGGLTLAFFFGRSDASLSSSLLSSSSSSESNSSSSSLSLDPSSSKPAARRWALLRAFFNSRSFCFRSASTRFFFNRRSRCCWLLQTHTKHLNHKA